MLIHRAKIFENFPEIIFGFSTKIGNGNNGKFGFNLSKSIGENEEIVEENRNEFFKNMNLSTDKVIVQKQTHSDIINYIEQFSNTLTGDALITKKVDLGLAVSTADCTNIYIYDPKVKIIAAVHSGWEGTEKKILEKTVNKLFGDFACNPKDFIVYFGPSISQKNYEVGKEFENKFDKKYLMPNKEKYLLDLKTANKYMLLNFGVPENQIEIDENCSYENPIFQSYRRDKQNSGRALGIIAMRN